MRYDAEQRDHESFCMPVTFTSGKLSTSERFHTIKTIPLAGNEIILFSGSLYSTLYLLSSRATGVCLTSSLTMPRLRVFFSFVQARVMVKMSQDGIYCDWIVLMMRMINGRMMCGLLWDRVRQMWMFGDRLWRCELLRCQGNSVFLWRRGCWRRVNLCCNGKCVRFSHGYQWKLRQRPGV